MSFAVHFVPAAVAVRPDPLGHASRDDAGKADRPAQPLSAEEVATWDGLHSTLVELLPDGAHDVTANPFSRQLVHEPTGLMVSWSHRDYQASVPFWSSGAEAGVLDALAAVTGAIESATGLVGVDEISDGRFLDHREQVAAAFVTIAGGFEQAMERQTVLGWLRSVFRRG